MQLRRGEPQPVHPERSRTVEPRSPDNRSVVPPPPPRTEGQRPPRVIDSQGFVVRPVIVRPEIIQDGTARPEVGRPEMAQADVGRPEAGRNVPKPPAAASAGASFPSEASSPGDFAENSTAPTRRRAVPLARIPGGNLQAIGEGSRQTPGRSVALRPVPPAEAEFDRRIEPERNSGAMPGFTLAAPGVPWARGRTGGDGSPMNAALREAFTPTRPKQEGAQFSGRYVQMQRIISAIEEERAHVVLYGERGSGKTSLANIIATKATEAGYFTVKFACSSELSFDEIFHSFLRRIPATFLAGGIGATSRAGIANFDELLPPGEIGIAELVAIFARLHDKHVILVIDEYDRVTSEETKNKLAELIKNMSDASVAVTLLLIGVAKDVDDLLGKHPSLQRTLVTIPLPLMTPDEIEAIILCGEEKSGLRFTPPVRQRIVQLAQGLPYHAQLLCLFAARNALRRRAGTVEREDLRYAVLRAAEEAEGKIKEAYALAIASQSGTAFKDVLFAAARCASDAFGTFAVPDVVRSAAAHGISLSALSLQFPLKKLTEPGRGAMLRRISGLDGLRYQFVSQMLRHHVLVRQAIERGLV